MLIPAAKRLHNRQHYKQIRGILEIIPPHNNRSITELRTIIDEEKKRRDKEFCEKIKTISIVAKKGVEEQTERNSHNRYGRVGDDNQHNRINDSRRDRNGSLGNFNNALGTVVVAKMMYDAMHRNHEDIHERSHIKEDDNYSSSLYSDSNPSSDNNDSSSY